MSDFKIGDAVEVSFMGYVKSISQELDGSITYRVNGMRGQVAWVDKENVFHLQTEESGVARGE